VTNPDDRIAASLRGFGPLGILAILVIFAGNLIVLPLSAVLVLVWARRSRTPWREIGCVRPRSWAGGAATGIVFGVAFERLGKLLGNGARSKPLIVILAAAWFGLAHFRDQGLPGVEQATIVGLVFGSIFAVTGGLGC
jgi:hypothetical protein